MLQTQQDKQVPAFSYEVFDRQLDHFTMMLKVLMDGWEDYSSQEMTFDIHSLCTKAARLCYLADQDLALQHTDVSHHRKEQNETYFTSFELIITTQFTKFMKKVLALVKAGKKVEGHSSPMFSSEISTLLPKLHDLLLMDGGRGQVSAAKAALAGTSLADVPLYGMVKDDHHRTRAIVDSEGREIAINMNRGTFTFITAIQDETHRFANAYRKQQMRKKSYSSTLTEVPGVGPKTAKALMTQFKSVGAVREATPDQLENTPGVGPQLAQTIYDYFHA